MRKWPIICGAFGFVLLAGAIVRNRINARFANEVRERVISTIREHFAGEVQFADLQVSLFPLIVIHGYGLTVRQHGRTDVAPLIRIQKFSTDVAVWDFLRTPRHVRKLTLEGLTVTVPPRGEGPRGNGPANTLSAPPGEKTPPPFNVLIDEIVADDAELDLLPAESSKLPRVFHIHHLALNDAGLGQAMSYHATLSNPLPAGEIECRGQFGPWQADNPGLTPVAGTYTFAHANLASFRGLGGILSSQGQFTGRLERLDVQGETDTPDFSLGVGGHPMPLATQFHAVVDGTTGNTMLEDVHAQLADSEVVARGGVFRLPGEKYRRVVLDAVSVHAKLQDLLRLVLKANKPPMTGMISFQTRIDIPPEEGVVADRLKLDGQFDISSGRFAQLNVQKTVAMLSHLGNGEPGEESPGSVVSNFAGKFVLQNAVMTLSNLSFDVPGASVHLDGTYALHGEGIDFRGTLRLHNRLSQMTTGWKAAVLRYLDPLFERHDAGTVLPIKITGTGSHPQFRLDMKNLFKPPVGIPSTRDPGIGG